MAKPANQATSPSCRFPWERVAFPQNVPLDEWAPRVQGREGGGSPLSEDKRHCSKGGPLVDADLNATRSLSIRTARSRRFAGRASLTREATGEKKAVPGCGSGRVERSNVAQTTIRPTRVRPSIIFRNRSSSSAGARFVGEDQAFPLLHPLLQSLSVLPRLRAAVPLGPFKPPASPSRHIGTVRMEWPSTFLTRLSDFDTM